LTQSFNVNVAVRESAALPVSLSNLVLDYIINKLYTRKNIATKMVQINAYADNVVMTSRIIKALEEALQELDNTAQDIGLIINQDKTLYESN
jgi:type II secretory pathway component PulC